VIVTGAPAIPEFVERLAIVGASWVKVQVRIFWTAVFPPVPAVNPMKPALSPTTVGISTGQLVVNDAFVTVSVMVMTNVVPS
jgi:hypothetical protein